MLVQRNTLVIDGENYPLADLGKGRRQWLTKEVPTQEGDGSVARPHTIYWHGGFGATRRFSGGPRPANGHHDYCFPAGTRVRSLSGVQTVFRRWYEGDLIKLTTARGHVLTGTPNHPVLTEQGWILLGSLHEGDSVLSSGVRRHGIAPDDEDGYVPIDEVFRLAAPRFPTPRGAAVPMDLDCNGFSKEVDVVRVDGFLRDRLDALFAEHRRELTFSSAQVPLRALSAQSHEFAGVERRGPLEPATHMSRANTALLDREAVPVGPRTLARDFPAGGRVDGPGTARLAVSTSDAKTPEPDADSGFGYPKVVSEVLRTFAGEVASDEVVLVERDFARCHVYSLETETGFYYAENVIVHNSENMNLTTEGWMSVAPIVTFLDVSGKSSVGKAFVLGGSKRSRLGGETEAGLGGGEYSDTPQWMERFGDFVYVLTGTHTITIDPAQTVPTHVETRNHGTAARARSADVFDSRLFVGLGDGVNAEAADSPRSSSSDPTNWVTTDVKRSIVHEGSGGALFTSKLNRVFRVAPGKDPTSSSNHTPTAGEVITDESDPVVGLVEYLRGLAAGTATTLRTLDPQSGYVSRALLPQSRLSASDYDGRAILGVGQTLLFAQTRAVSMFRPGVMPEKVGPELMEENDSPYIGGEYGVPDWAGDAAYWPVFFPATGDSVIFEVRERQEGDPGVGRWRWMPFIFLENVECRVVLFWGGTSTIKPRLLFGATSTTVTERIGWVDLGQGGGPDVFTTDATPARSGTVFGADDDFNLPNTIQDVERIEMPEVLNADSDNFVVWSVSDDGGLNYKDLVKNQKGGFANRMDENGFQTVYAETGNVPSGRKLKVRCDITQEAIAASFLQIRGFSTIYLSARSITTEQVQTVLDVHPDKFNGVTDQLDALKAHVSGPKVELEGDPADANPWIDISDVSTVEVEDRNGDMRKAVQVTFREVAVGG